VAETTDNDTAAEGRQYIVGVGASAGGLEALVSFFSALPSDSGMAFVVVQHLSPDHKSLMVELLAKHTEMPVQHATDGMLVEPNHIYLIPPSKNITIYHGSLFLADQDRSLGHINFPIDLFFDSLAEDKGEEAIAVVLSGTGSDGTRGVGAVKDKGGLIVVQDPETAQYSGMPRSALRTGLVDRVLAPDAMPEALLQFIRAPLHTREVMAAADYQAGEDNGFAKIRSLLRHQFDVDFSAYKPSTVVRRIEHRMNIHQLGSIAEYAEHLRHHSREVQMLYRDLLIGVTRFFRDAEAFAELQKQVIPRVVDAAVNRQLPAVRVWVAGCSTGEEAYSIAMLFHEYLQEREQNIDLKIFATDIDQAAISRAATGAYPDSTVADLTPERRRTFFIKIGSQYQVTRDLRGSVIFAPHNLLKDPPFSKLDLISCRNLLIYLKPETQEQVLANFSYALREKGFLFLGSSESITGKGLSFTAINAKHRLYRQQQSILSRPRRPLDATAYQRGRVEADPKQSATGTMPRLVDGLFDDLLDEYVPAAVLVNAEGHVMHVFGDVNEYMSVPAGKANMDVHRMVHPSIKTLVGTALHKARKEGERVVYPAVTIEDDEDCRRFDLIVDMEQIPHGDVLFLIIFDDVSTEAAPRFSETPRTYDLESAAQERIEDLDRKLRYTEENLQATVEELETSNEELQATNEELMAANEELQSTNEELHSVNEELVTVNAELQEKIRQLTELNSDMDNLLQSTEVSTIFLDTELRIRKFTESAAEYVNLLPADEGRPIHHFAHAFKNVDLHTRAENVLEKGERIEHEIEGKAGAWYRFRALPYLTADEVVKGVVLTFIDITEEKQLRGALAAERQRRRTLEAAADTTDPPPAAVPPTSSPTDSEDA
jgi:two-component system CheB/CheR fusion protein